MKSLLLLATGNKLKALAAQKTVNVITNVSSKIHVHYTVFMYTSRIRIVIPNLKRRRRGHRHCPWSVLLCSVINRRCPHCRSISGSVTPKAVLLCAPIGLREPKYSPFGPGRLERVWTGVCAPAVDPKQGSPQDETKLEEERRVMREKIQGEPLTNAERKALVERCQRHRTKRQINLGRDGLTHNMLNDIHNHWKHAEAVRIKCMGVPTVNMKNVCSQLEDKTFGKIIQRHGGSIVLYRGRNYDGKKRPVIPLMLWKPHEPVYPRLIKTTIDGLSIEETKEMRKRGLAVPALTKLAKNGYYASLVPMVRDAFLTEELVRIDCKGLPRSDYKKIGCKLRDLVPCILVTFEKEQIVVWRGKHYKPKEDGFLLPDREIFDDPNDALGNFPEENETRGEIEFC
nr:crs2-associated factor 1, mitochondrial [Ipomoea batatas]